MKKPKNYYIVLKTGQANEPLLALVGEGFEVDDAITHIKIKGSAKQVPSLRLSDDQYELLRSKKYEISFDAYEQGPDGPDGEYVMVDSSKAGAVDDSIRKAKARATSDLKKILARRKAQQTKNRQPAVTVTVRVH